MRIPERPPPFDRLITEIGMERLTEIVAPSGPTMLVDGKYVHWEKLRYLEPPDGLTSEEWWFLIKFSRINAAKSLPGLISVSGDEFTYSLPDRAHELFHRIDGDARGRLATPEAVVNPSTRDRYLVNSVLEEAITSSQLEGAATTRQEAQALIREGREPKNRHERMVSNNFKAMLYVREIQDEALTSSVVLELHRVVTEGTLDEAEAAGRLQRPVDRRVTVDDAEGNILHTPPPADELPERLEKMVAFANQEDGNGFVHPVLRSIILHFWLAYDHPFEDGNGRTARALFYWSMLHQGYWLVEFLSISRILRVASVRYGTSFLETETDNYDLTYFILHHLEVLNRALDEMTAYLSKKVAEVREVEDLVRSSSFNHRQLALLGHALRNFTYRYTYKSHANSHSVSRPTAATDLAELWRLGLLKKIRAGREVSFIPVENLADRLRELGNDSS